MGLAHCAELEQGKAQEASTSLPVTHLPTWALAERWLHAFGSPMSYLSLTWRSCSALLRSFGLRTAPQSSLKKGARPHWGNQYQGLIKSNVVNCTAVCRDLFSVSAFWEGLGSRKIQRSSVTKMQR